jgi:hypothetical protein
VSPDQQLERAGKAEKLLNDPMLIEAFDLVRTTILKNIENAPIRDREGLHECRLMLELLRGVRANLEQAVRDGKVVVAALEEKRRLAPAEFSQAYRR